MPQALITALTADANPAATSLVEIETGGNSRKSTLAEILKNTASTLTQRGTTVKGAAVATLGGVISNPPTQAEVTAVRDKLNALITSLTNAGHI